MLDVELKPDELTSSTHTQNILLAEDDSSIRRFIEVILQRQNYAVLTAEDGLEAMKLALSNKIDAVVADAMMPNLSGYDLCRMMRQNSIFQNIPFIILSGLEPDKTANAGCQADAYLLKGNNLKVVLTEKLSELFVKKSIS